LTVGERRGKPRAGAVVVGREKKKRPPGNSGPTVKKKGGEGLDCLKSIQHPAKELEREKRREKLYMRFAERSRPPNRHL